MMATMHRNLTSRVDRVLAPMIPVVGQWIADHPGTISLGQGMVHFDPPAEVGRAVAHAAAGDARLHRYGPVRGTDEYLAKIQHKLARDNKIVVDASRRVVATAGANMAFFNAVLSIGDVGDEIILLRPFYFNHHMAVEIAGRRPVEVCTRDEHQLDLAAIERAISPRTRAVVTISPNNPTGVTYTHESLAGLNRLCQERGLYHISDETYEYFVYDGHVHFSPASLPQSDEHTISIFSLSKAYGMAGWRAGYMVIPAHMETAIHKVQDTNLICPPLITQAAAGAALDVGREWCAERIAGYQQVRDLVMNELDSLGEMCVVPRPDGAFYVYVRLDTNKEDVELVHSLIRDHGVATMPGGMFGAKGACTLRIAYGALSRETVAEGMGRLTRGLRAMI